MSGKTKLYLGVFVALALVIGGLFVLSVDRRSDEEMIIQALNDSIEASMEGRPGGVLDFLSDKLRVSGYDNIPKAQIAKIIRDNKPQVTVKNQTVTILPDGETAEIVSDVQVKADIKEIVFSYNLDRTLKGARMVFKKESGRKYLIFPVKVWRLAEVDLPNDAGLIEDL